MKIDQNRDKNDEKWPKLSQNVENRVENYENQAKTFKNNENRSKSS